MNKIGIISGDIYCIGRIQTALKSSDIKEAVEVHVGPGESIECVLRKICDCDVVFLGHEMPRFTGEDIAISLSENVRIISIAKEPVLAMEYADAYLPKEEIPCYPEHESHDLFESREDYWLRKRSVMRILVGEEVET